MATRTHATTAAVAALTLTSLVGCSSAAKDAAQEAYEACKNDAASTQVMRLDGREVLIEVKGDAARAFSGVDDEIDRLGETEDLQMDGIVVAMNVVLAAECMVEETGYPGSYEQLTDGEEWDGWRYHENPGAGSEVTFVFEAR